MVPHGTSIVGDLHVLLYKLQSYPPETKDSPKNHALISDLYDSLPNLWVGGILLFLDGRFCGGQCCCSKIVGAYS